MPGRFDEDQRRTAPSALKGNLRSVRDAVMDDLDTGRSIQY